MKYVEFRESVHAYLKSHREGATWKEMKTDLGLPYEIPCPTWVHKMEDEIGLSRVKGTDGKVWMLRPRKDRR